MTCLGVAVLEALGDAVARGGRSERALLSGSVEFEAAAAATSAVACRSALRDGGTCA